MFLNIFRANLLNSAGDERNVPDQTTIETVVAPASCLEKGTGMRDILVNSSKISIRSESRRYNVHFI